MGNGKLYVVSAPSGAGKTSLLAEVCSALPNLKIAVSHTTRTTRPGEVDGEHYHFIGQKEFLAMVKQGDFIEHAEVFGNFYGTSKKSVKSLLDADDNVVLEIDWQGAQQVRQVFPDVISIFILPPSIEELENRLRSRAQDSEEVIAGRMDEARSEISHYHEYQFLVINDDMAVAVKELINLFTSPEQFQPPSSEQLEKLLSSLK